MSQAVLGKEELVGAALVNTETNGISSRVGDSQKQEGTEEFEEE